MQKTNAKTESEILFEKYLHLNKYANWEFEPEIADKSKKPDYGLSWKNELLFFEMKELHSKEHLPDRTAFNSSPLRRIREKINEGRKKFKKFKESSCSLIVCNISDWKTRLDTFDVFAAMLGDPGISIDFDSRKGTLVEGTEQEAFLSGGAMVREKTGEAQNTTINAIIVLEKISAKNLEFLRSFNKEVSHRLQMKKNEPLDIKEIFQIRWQLYDRFPQVSFEIPRVRVIENPFARIPFAKEIFQGPYDERWVLEEDLKRIFAGESLKIIEQLESMNWNLS